jgi:aminopeptidase N
MFIIQGNIEQGMSVLERRGKKNKAATLFLVILTISSSLLAQLGSQNSGGTLSPQQAAYDVKFYDLNFSIFPEDSSIEAEAKVEAEIVSSLKTLVLDLDSRYSIQSINSIDGDELKFKHDTGKIYIEFHNHLNPGEQARVKINYSGKPRVAKRPPWDDGFTWKKSADGSPWIGVTCQGGGADIWWPCKDHPSDEPDSMRLSYTIPTGLFCASNGTLVEQNDNENGTATFIWFVSNPINNYGVSFNIGAYETITYNYESIAGVDIPVTIWVLPENMEKAKAHCPQFLDHLKFYEETCGPYPFRNEKYGVAESPYLGMEHQTIIANGNDYKNNEYGFDWLHHHELAHEWWGNMVTAKDWSDFWIHEGIGGYMQALYVEQKFGAAKYREYLLKWKLFSNSKPIAARGKLTTEEAYFPDMYRKGAWAIHTLRYLVGDDAFFKILRRWAYPNPELEKIVDGRQCRFATTDKFMMIAEDISGIKLDWFFEVYFRQASLPKLLAKQRSNKLILGWTTENNIKFPMPVEVKVGNEIVKLDMSKGTGKLEFKSGIKPEIDPNKWLTIDDVNIIIQ